MADERAEASLLEDDTLEVISLNSMDLEEVGLEGWTVLDEDLAGQQGQQDDSAAPTGSSSRKTAMENISSPEDFSFEEEAKLSTEVAPLSTALEEPAAAPHELRQVAAAREEMQDKQVVKGMPSLRAASAKPTPAATSVEIVEADSAEPAPSARELAAAQARPLEESAPSAVGSTTISGEENSEVPAEEVSKEGALEKKSEVKGSTAEAQEAGPTPGAGLAEPEGTAAANSCKQSPLQDAAVPTGSSEASKPQVATGQPTKGTLNASQSAGSDAAGGSGPGESEASQQKNPAKKPAMKSPAKPSPKLSENPKKSEKVAEKRQSARADPAGERKVKRQSSPLPEREDPVQSTRRSSARRASQHGRTEASSRSGEAHPRPSSTAKGSSAGGAREGKEGIEDKQKTRSPRGSGSGGRGVEGKKSKEQREGKGDRPGEMLRRRSSRPLQPVAGVDQEASCLYDNLVVLGQSNGPWKWELQLLQLTMADLQSQELEALCEAAHTTHWFSMQGPQAETKYGMLSLLFDNMQEVKVAMSLLYKTEPTVQVHKVALLRILDYVFPVKTARVSFTINFNICDRIPSVQDNTPIITHSPPSKGAMTQQFLQLGGLPPDLPQDILVEMLQVLFPKAVHIFLGKPAKDKPQECFIKMPTRRTLASTLRSVSGFALNGVYLPLYDFVPVESFPRKQDSDLMSISSDEAFSNEDGLSNISDNRSEYSYIWSDDLSDIMSDDSFTESPADASRFQTPLILEKSSSQAGNDSQPMKKPEPKQSRTSSLEQKTEVGKKEMPQSASPAPQADSKEKKTSRAPSKPATSDRDRSSNRDEGSTKSSKIHKDARVAKPPRDRRRSPAAGRPRRSPPTPDRVRHDREDWHRRGRRRSPPPPSGRRRSVSPHGPRRGKSRSPKGRRRSRTPEPPPRPRVRRSRSRSPVRRPRLGRSRSRSQERHRPWYGRSRSRSPGGGGGPRSSRHQQPWDQRVGQRPGSTSPISSASSRSGKRERSPRSSRIGYPLDYKSRPPSSGPPHAPPRLGPPIHPGLAWQPPRYGAPAVAPYLPGLPPPPFSGPPHPSASVPQPSVPSNDRMLMEAADIQAMAKEALRSLGVSNAGPSRTSGGHLALGARRRSHSPHSPLPHRSSTERYGRSPHGATSPKQPRWREGFSRSQSRERDWAGQQRGSRERDLQTQQGGRGGRDSHSSPHDIETIVKKVVQNILGERIMTSQNQDDLDKVKTLTRRVLAVMGGEEEEEEDQRSARPETQGATQSSQWRSSPARGSSTERLDRAARSRSPETTSRRKDYEQEAERQIDASIQRERMKERYEGWDRSYPRDNLPQQQRGPREGRGWEGSADRSRPPMSARPYSPLSPEMSDRGSSPPRGLPPGPKPGDRYGRPGAGGGFPASKLDDPYQRGLQREESPLRFGSQPHPSSTGSGGFPPSAQAPDTSPLKNRPIKGILKKSKPAEEPSSGGGAWGGGNEVKMSVPGSVADRPRDAPVTAYDRQPPQPYLEHPHHHQPPSQTWGYDSTRGPADEGTKVFDYGHLGQRQERETSRDVSRDQPRQEAAADRRVQGKDKVQPLSRSDLERVCDIETFKKLQIDDTRQKSYRKEFRESNWCAFTNRMEFFEIYGVMCIKQILEHCPPGWLPTEHIIVPRALRPLFVKLAHESPEGHLPQYQTMDRISSNFTWPSVNPDVTAHVSMCKQCQAERLASAQASSQVAMAAGYSGGQVSSGQRRGGAGGSGDWRSPAQDAGSSNWFAPASAPAAAAPAPAKSTLETPWPGNTDKVSAAPTPLSRAEIMRHCSFEELGQSQREDPELQAMIEVASPPEGKCVKPDFTVANGILFRRVPSSPTQPALLKVVVPRKFRQAFLETAHRGEDGRHWGVEPLTNAIALNYYWPTMWVDAKQCVHKCPVCTYKY